MIQEPQIGLQGVVGVVSGVSAACLGGTLGGIFGVNRYAGERLTAAEFTRFESFVAATQPALALHLFAPTESSTIDIAPPSTQLGCNGSTVSSEIAWRSSVISPVAGTFQVGTGCSISANKLPRGTQMLTVYRSTEPTRKSSVKVTAIKSEAHLSLSHTGDYVLPMGSYFLNLQLNWNSQDVGSQVFLTEQIDNNAEELLSDTLYGATSRQINTDHVAKYRLRRAVPNAALTGAVLDEKQVTVLSTAVVPLETPTMVTYPIGIFNLKSPSSSSLFNNCPTGVCTFALRWLSDASFGVQHEIKQRRLSHCDTFEPYTCHFQSWVDLPVTTGTSRVISFAAQFDQIDQFQFSIRPCAQFRVCSDWSQPIATIDGTLYGASISANPASGSWTIPISTPPPSDWQLLRNCKAIPESLLPTLTIFHDYPFYSNLMEGTKPPSVDGSIIIPPDTTVLLRLNHLSVEPQFGQFSLSLSTPVLARLNLNIRYVIAADGQSALCKYGPL